MNATFVPRRSGPSGFSLVEVALAVAIAALGIITCLGLLPEGLQMSRQTSQMTLNRNIFDQIIRDLESTSFWTTLKPKSQLPRTTKKSPPTPVSKPRFYYSDQGTPMKSDDEGITFVVEADMTQPASLPGFGSGYDQTYLARIIVRVANTTRPDFEFKEENARTYFTFSHLIAKTRY